ncbi:kelch repeat and BTB domain-containing protein 2-like [Amphiura filiformis]|uniref:kelch repeat and BTB domain-containing protein 2-like n=1 Tax=Amphiura filiformis TaxID=82378 RepID=UPI003B21D992
MAAFKQDQCVQRVGNQSHLSRLSSGLNQLRQQAAFCDVNIIVGDQRFPAHKAVLSCASDYFQGMFSSGFQESTMSEITVPGTEESFAQILDFAYTGYFTLSLRTVTGILQMACYMVIPEAMDLCAEYLREVKDSFTIEDYYEIWCITSNHSNLADIAQLYRSYLAQRFSECVQPNVFLENSSANVMLEILSDEDIETDNMTEEHILQGTVMWLKYDWEQRKVHAVDLLQKIRLGLVPIDRLHKILGDELLAVPECKDIVEEVIKLSATKDTASPPLVKSHPELFATRNTITARLEEDYDHASTAPIILLTCKTKTACYNITKLADVPNRYPYSDDKFFKAFVSNENQLYAAIDVGYYDGPDGETRYNWLKENNFFWYKSETNEWILLPPMPELLIYPRMVQIKEYIYLIGEVKIDTSKNMIQRFSIGSKSWEILVDDILIESLFAVALPTGQILVKGEQVRAGPNPDGSPYAGFRAVVVALYKPATNELLDVSVDKTLDLSSLFVANNNGCYLFTRSKDKEPEQVNRVILDFDCDRPSMVIGEVVEDETIDIEKQFYPEFTFDKRKLGLVQVPCECESHVK